MRPIVTAPDFLDDNYLSTEFRVPGHPAGDQRLQPAGHQRDRRQHLGQLLVAVLQGSAVGRRDHLVSPLHRRAAQLHDAGRRPRLHAAALAHQPLVHGAVPAQQHRRPLRAEPVGRGADARRSRTPSTRCCGPRAATRTPARRQDSGRDRPRRRPRAGRLQGRARLRHGAAGLPARLPAADCSARSRLLFPKVFTDRRHRLGPIPPGDADRPAGQRQPAVGRPRSGEPARGTRNGWARCWSKVLEDLHALGGNATDEQAREAFKDLVDPLLEVSKCPDLIVNRGHLFGTTLPDADKRALIEFLKTF